MLAAAEEPLEKLPPPARFPKTKAPASKSKTGLSEEIGLKGARIIYKEREGKK